MEKYIKAETICNFIDGCLAHEDKITDIEKETLCAMKSFIERTPFADVVEVRHGRWRDTGSGQECSICKEIQYGYDTGRHYCPNCGAKMDGAIEESTS